MKQSILILFLFFGCLSYSQSIVKYSIDSGGASSSNGNIQILYSFGEINVQESVVGNIILSEGFISSGEVTLSNNENEPMLKFLVYPNPTKGMLYIKGDTNKLINVEIYTTTGQRVMAVKNNFRTIDISNLNSALFFIKINTEEARATFKIIKE